jgi:hypothetical protein
MLYIKVEIYDHESILKTMGTTDDIGSNLTYSVTICEVDSLI